MYKQMVKQDSKALKKKSYCYGWLSIHLYVQVRFFDLHSTKPTLVNKNHSNNSNSNNNNNHLWSNYQDPSSALSILWVSSNCIFIITLWGGNELVLLTKRMNQMPCVFSNNLLQLSSSSWVSSSSIQSWHYRPRVNISDYKFRTPSCKTVPTWHSSHKPQVVTGTSDQLAVNSEGFHTPSSVLIIL